MMKYPKEYLDEIKIRLKVSQIVGKTVQLKRRGKEFIGLSPFKNEKTPSFTVNDEKGFYHCFSSGEHGNVFDFLMKTQSLRFGEAVKTLAAEAGMQQFKFTKLDEKREKRYQLYKGIYLDYQNLNKKNLFFQENADVLNYLVKRGLSKKTIEEFNVGFSKNNSLESLRKKFSEEELIQSGIFYKNEATKNLIDRFKSRILFPINNLSGDTIAFGGRAISKNAIAKYINSPETEFYKKGKILFNLDKAKNLRSKTDQVIIVEGYMDVLSLYNKGVYNVISNSGTAITENQIDLIWNFFLNPIISLDGDKSGQNASIRIAERLFPKITESKNIHFLSLPDGKDPDDFINKNGKEAFEKIVYQKENIKDFIWRKYLSTVNFSNPFEISKFEKDIKKLCNTINDSILKKYITEDFLAKFNELTPNYNLKNTKKIYNFKKEKILIETKNLHNQKNKFDEIALKEFSILYILLKKNNLMQNKLESIANLKFENELNNKIKNDILQQMTSDTFEIKSFENKFQNEIKDIFSFANVRLILPKKNDQEVLIIFEELISDYNNSINSKKIESFEKKLLEKFDENSYSELIKLKKQLNPE